MLHRTDGANGFRLDSNRPDRHSGYDGLHGIDRIRVDGDRPDRHARTSGTNRLHGLGRC